MVKVKEVKDIKLKKFNFCYNQYNAIYWPCYKYLKIKTTKYQNNNIKFWANNIWNFFFDEFDGIFGKFAWSKDIGMNWREVLDNIIENISMFLTPFYKPRRLLISNFIECNGGKLLTFSRKFASIRNRENDCAYYLLKCGFITATVTRVRWVDKTTKQGRLVFIEGTDDTKKEEKIIAKGKCLTLNQCEKLYKKIVKATPELCWF